MQRNISKLAGKYDLSGAGIGHHFTGRGVSQVSETGTAEVHLATGFQNMTYDSKAFPRDFKEEIYNHLRQVCAEEKKSGESDEQFIYNTLNKGFGPFK
jgi:hypothetical protein